MRSSFKRYDCVIACDIKNDLGTQSVYFDMLKKENLNKLDVICSNWYVIKHDRDIKDNKQVYAHYHLLLILKSEISKTNLIVVLSKLYDLPLNVISVEKCILFDLSLQYLIHKNSNKDKVKYNTCEVFSKYGDYDTLIDNNVSERLISDKEVYNLIFNDRLTQKELIKYLGFDYYKKYYWVISELYKWRK